ncbi:MAG: hypothetical protein K9G33_09170 [Sneathiella sp.]|nr:hypothetical protein [Sneathiella sp.]
MNKFAKLAFSGLAFVAVSSCGGNEDYLQKNITANEPEDCKPVVEKEIDRLKIDRSNIEKTDYITYYISQSDTGEEYNYQGWMHFKNCSGNFVVNMNRFCQIQTTFSTGNCQLDKLIAKK